MVETLPNTPSNPAYFGLSEEQFQQPAEDLPIGQVVAKVHGRCDLACPNCYVFELADQSWRQLPREMAPNITRAMAWRLGRHAARHELEEVKVILHGGEPTLIGPNGIDFFADTVRSYMPPETAVKFGMQTNGVQISQPKGFDILNALRRNRIRTNVSLDGVSAINDQSRPFPDGRSSFDATMRAIERLRTEYPDIFAGVLAVVDPRSNPVETYNLLASQSKVFDFLIPHYNWTNRHPSYADDPRSTPIGDWLIQVFDQWFEMFKTQPDKFPRVRFFESAIRVVMGHPSLTDHIGITFPNVVVIDTDGAIEIDDSYLSTYQYATATGLNVVTHDLAEVQAHPLMRAQRLGKVALPRACQACSIVDLCGGGHPAHRWDEKNGFDNPSSYCRDLMKFISHVRDRLIKSVKKETTP